ncbi:hypothetical protein [Oleiharenicola lentus]|uniref:hypothetical protein n=1 Tax=Oleiharenicola lentus TaxID=2508720 RepID=UPI003F668AE3
MTYTTRRLTLLIAAALAAVTSYAQSVPSTGPQPAQDEPRPLLSRITSIFDGDLPQIDIPGTVKVILRPHFGDLVRRDYMRTETGLRWALNEQFEVSSEGSIFFTHGLGDSVGYGVGRLRLGSRYTLDAWPRSGYDTSFLLNMEAPVGHPPIDMTDGQYHLTPSVIVQRQSKTNKKFSTFAGLGFDFIDPSSIPGRFATNQPHEDSVNTTIGAVYDLGQLKYSLSGTYATTAILSDNTEHFFYLTPGVQWYLPRRFTFNSKTQWIVSLGARTSWGPDGTDFSLRARARAELTFRQVMEKIRFRRGDEEKK